MAKRVSTGETGAAGGGRVERDARTAKQASRRGAGTGGGRAEPDIEALVDRVLELLKQDIIFERERLGPIW